MKNLLILLAIFIGVVAANAQTFNGEVANSTTIKTRVIQPFQIMNAQNQDGSDAHLPDVIVGQTRDLTPDLGLYLFKVVKDINHTAAFTFSGANPVNGVTLTVQWYWVDKDPAVHEWATTARAIPQQWTWAAGETEPSVRDLVSNTHWYYAVLKVDKIKANAGILPGKRTFTITASGKYTDL